MWQQGLFPYSKHSRMIITVIEIQINSIFDYYAFYPLAEYIFPSIFSDNMKSSSVYLKQRKSNNEYFRQYGIYKLSVNKCSMPFSNSMEEHAEMESSMVENFFFHLLSIYTISHMQKKKKRKKN